MDQFYDEKEAGSALKAIRDARITDDQKLQVSALGKESNWESEVEVMGFKEPTCWRLIWGTDGKNHAAEEEVMLFTVGVIEKMDLPPLKLRYVTNGKDLKYFKQAVVLSGLGSEDFQDDIDGVLEMYALFSRQLGNAATYHLPQYAGHDTLEFSNRYFTSRRDAPDAPPAQVNPLIDPEGAIARVNETNTQYKYIDDNKVVYREVKTIEGNPSTVSTNPQRFAIGDIVEVGFSMIAVPVKGGEMKILLQLRSVTLVDGTFTQKALKKRKKEEANEGRRKTTVKRPVCFEDNEMNFTQRKFSRLNINEGRARQYQQNGEGDDESMAGNEL